MGLDMYLYADKYVSRKNYDVKIADEKYGYDYATNEAFQTIVSAVNAESLVDNEWSGMTVSIPVGYWRKANAIHGWIVNNCADGLDECQRIYISRDKAKELVEACKAVLADKSLAEQLLPPQSGFFFGSYEIDEWYMRDLEQTIQIFEKVLAAAERDEIDGVTYQASW